MSDDANPKDRLGVKKPALSLVPAVLFVFAAVAFLEGALKYGAFNWRRKKVKRRVYLEAILRHAFAALAGEDYDAETLKATGHKIPHEAKIVACCGIILDAQETGNLIDDRFEQDPTARVLARFTAGDYAQAASEITRTPARTLDEIAAARAEAAHQSWADAAIADRADAGRQVDQALDRATPCTHRRLTLRCPFCEPLAEVAERTLAFLDPGLVEQRLAEFERNGGEFELPIAAYGPG